MIYLLTSKYLFVSNLSIINYLSKRRNLMICLLTYKYLLVGDLTIMNYELRIFNYLIRVFINQIVL